jgi:hypothetical protein
MLEFCPKKEIGPYKSRTKGKQERERVEAQGFSAGECYLPREAFRSTNGVINTWRC